MCECSPKSIKLPGYSYILTIDIPNTCPHCHEKNTPEVVGIESFNPNLKVPLLGCLVKCSSCKDYFALGYSLNLNSSGFPIESKLMNYTYKPKYVYDLPTEIDTISSEFREVYSQSQIAELQGLDKIAGVGYRKSLEFLVKDYLIYQKPKEKESILKLSLSPAINKIENPKIKSLALASTWLGNDETHYLKKYEDKDINDMKRLLKSLAYLVASEINSDEAVQIIESNSSIGSK